MSRLLQWAAGIVPRLPPRLRRVIPAVAAPLAYLVAADNRRQALRNAAQVLGAASLRTLSGRLHRHRVVVAMFRTSIANYLDLLAMAGAPARDMLDRIDGADRDVIDEALALGKGAIVFGAHFGPIEQVGLWFSAHGYRVVIPVEQVSDAAMLRLTTHLRNLTGTTFVPLGGMAGVRALLAALRQNQIVLLPADRAIGPVRSVVHGFFGAPARLPFGPVELALRTGAPLLGGFCWRTAAGRTAMKFTRLTTRLPPQQRRDPDRLQSEIVAELECTIAADPGQWVVFRPVWIDR